MEYVKLGELCTFRQGTQVPIEEQFFDIEQNYVRFLRIIDYTQENEPPRYVINNGTYVKKDDIVMVRYGTIGYVGRGIEGVLANNLFLIVPKDKNILKDYLYYYFKSNSFISRIRKLSTGSSMQALSFKIMDNIKVPLFSIEKQMNIVKEFDKIYDFLKVLNKNIENLETIVKSQFIEMFGDCNEYTNITNCVDIMDHLRRPINSEERMKMQDGILYPYYGATGQVGYINDYLSDFDGLCIAEDCGNYKAGEESAYIVKGKIWVNNHAHLLKCKANYNLYFLKEFLFQADLSEYVNGATRQKLTQSKLREIKVLNPSLELQNKFADFVQQIDKSKFIVQKQIKLLEELLEKKMNEYFGN